ncbi:SIMPL domain-containing protein [Bartonella sp. A05]|uniref:SIMPL domain-containing protein n=1 Tax=Bartonella sp. A05 TaxID=2967261 RepID=UPI0022A92046|nr:SIMPL domain-containing protein [Bartonella sp. A05]MCZ2204077.1 SIMPL domain-containing protein [Bartonella sp. A05]
MTKAIFHPLNRYRFKITILAALALLTTSFSVHAEESTVQNSIITVTATGESRATPDMAIINLAVITHDKTAQAALASNNKSMNDVINTLKNNGIQAQDLQTSGLSIYTISADEKKNNKDLYQVSNHLTVRIRDLANAGKIFDQAMALGINSVHGITFTNAETKPFYIEARKQAIAEAIEKAKILAQAANVKLGKIIKITENDGNSRPITSLISSARSVNYENTNFAGGELNYGVSVTIIFAID